MVSVVEYGIVLHGVLLGEKGAIAFFGAIKFKYEVLAPFGSILGS